MRWGQRFISLYALNLELKEPRRHRPPCIAGSIEPYPAQPFLGISKNLVSVVPRRSSRPSGKYLFLVLRQFRELLVELFRRFRDTHIAEFSRSALFGVVEYHSIRRCLDLPGVYDFRPCSRGSLAVFRGKFTEPCPSAVGFFDLQRRVRLYPGFVGRLV